jgi:hypothetical protein
MAEEKKEEKDSDSVGTVENNLIKNVRAGLHMGSNDYTDYIQTNCEDLLKHNLIKKRGDKTGMRKMTIRSTHMASEFLADVANALLGYLGAGAIPYGEQMKEIIKSQLTIRGVPLSPATLFYHYESHEAHGNPEFRVYFADGDGLHANYVVMMDFTLNYKFTSSEYSYLFLQSIETEASVDWIVEVLTMSTSSYFKYRQMISAAKDADRQKRKTQRDLDVTITEISGKKNVIQSEAEMKSDLEIKRAEAQAADKLDEAEAKRHENFEKATGDEVI